MSQERRARGTGSILDLPDGRHRYKYRDAAGILRWGPISDDRAQVERELNSAIVDRDRGVRATSRDKRLGSWCDQWIELHVGKLKPRSETRYRAALDAWKATPLASAKLHELQPEAIALQLGRWRRDGVGHAAIAFRLAVLRPALDAAVQYGHLAVNYARPPWTPTPPRVERRIAPPGGSDLTALRAAMLEDRNAAIWMLALDAGLRQGEILALRMRDLELDADPPTVHVRGTLQYGTDIVGSPKSRHGTRSLPVVPTVVDALRRHLAERFPGMTLHPDAFVFQGRDGGAIHARMLLDDWYDLCHRVLGPGRRYRFHDLRHAFVSESLRRGIPLHSLSLYVGHSTIDMTYDQYAHMAIEAPHPKGASAP